MKAMFQTAWIFVTLNYLYCDLIGLMDPDLLKQFLSGTAGGIPLTQGFFLGAAILMEIPMSMVFLSRALNYRADRWANIAAGTVMTLVQIGSLFVGSRPTMYYLFFSAVEIATTSLIVVFAIRWRSEHEAA